MPDKLEKLIKMVYRKWQFDHSGKHRKHPDAQDLACFFEGRMKPQESDKIKAHLSACGSCAEAAAIEAKLRTGPLSQGVPQDLIAWAKSLVPEKSQSPVLEIVFKLKEDAVEIIRAAADILIGQELLPLPVLRSRKIKDFKDEVTIFKDFEKARVELRIENKSGRSFDLSVVVRERQSQQAIRDLRVTLLQNDLELESSLSASGRVTFEGVRIGKYTVEIASLKNKLASILLDVKT